MLHTLSPLKQYRSQILVRMLAPDVRMVWQQLRRSPHWAPLTRQVLRLGRQGTPARSLELNEDAIRILPAADVEAQELEAVCKQLLPWRIGPYDLGAFTIDAEWCSYRKWTRLKPLLGELTNLRIADVGCNSGYFLFKLAAQQPEVAIGFDPVERCWLQFGLLQSLARIPTLAFVPSGISSLDAFPEFFDVVMCMGVLYHQRDPFTACKKLFTATKPGGRVVLESLVIPQAGSYLLVPRERYAKMRNAWVIPTPEALVALLERAGFTHAEVHNFGPITAAEQRRTEWAPYESLQDFLDPHDPTKTVEGHSAPHSAVVIATKK